jgi:hypothetical protein
MREKAIAEYHEFLAADEGLTKELFARLKAAMSTNRLLYGQRELGVALRPHLLTRRQYDLLAYRSRVLAGAFEQVAAALLDQPALLPRLGLSELEQRLALIDPGYKHATITSRLDGFFFGDELKFVEYNAENPSSLTDQAGLNQVLFELRALQQFAERYRLRQFAPVAGLLHALLTTWREWGGRGAPHIAILDWPDLPTEHEFVLLRNYLVSSGLPAIICAPDELEYQGGHGKKLRRGAFQIDLVYKRVIYNEFLVRYDETQPLLQAYRDHAVCLINPFRCKLLHKKASFELLTDEAYHRWFSAEALRVIAHSIPWTRRVNERKTTYQGREVDLLELLWRERERFILKPNDDYGGRGLLFGKSASASEWDEALERALASDYVAQEVLALETEEFPIFNEHTWNIQPMYVDTNPFLFRGEVEGAMVRLSDSPIVNVMSGGGETGFFVLEEE